MPSRSPGLIAGGVDMLAPETSFDTLVMKACLFAIDKYFTEHNVRLPVMISGRSSRITAHCRCSQIEAFYTSVSHFDALSVGVNTRGRRSIRPHVETLSGVCRTP